MTHEIIIQNLTGYINPNGQKVLPMAKTPTGDEVTVSSLGPFVLQEFTDPIAAQSYLADCRERNPNHTFRLNQWSGNSRVGQHVP